MRSSVENTTALQNKINKLQLENQILKNILDHSGISYAQELRKYLEIDETSEYDPNQGARIRWPQYLTNEMVDLFFPDSKAGWMSMPKDLRRKQARLDILLNALIFGRISVQEGKKEKSAV